MSTLSLPLLDRTSTAPIWFQIMRAIEAEIARAPGTGDRLPSENELREHFSASRTLDPRRAVPAGERRHHLPTAGQGRLRGTSPGSVGLDAPLGPELLASTARDGRSALSSEILRAGIEPLPSWAAAVVGRDSPDGTGFVLERVRAVGSRTAVHVINYLPSRFGRGAARPPRPPRESLRRDQDVARRPHRPHAQDDRGRRRRSGARRSARGRAGASDRRRRGRRL